MSVAEIDMLADMLVKDEGIRFFPYVCSAGKVTWLCGRNIQDKPLTIKEKAYITKNGVNLETVDYILENDINDVYKELDKNFKWYQKHNMARQNVLECMCFQLGINRLKGFENFLRYLKLGDYKNASIEMLDSNWHRQTPARAKRLANIMKTGVIDNYYLDI